jgi:hypothetical protein
MNKITLFVLSLLALVGGTATTAFAAESVDPTDGPSDVLGAIYRAFSGGHYAFAAALGVMLGVPLVKRWLGGTVPALHSQAGTAAIALVGSAAAAVVAGATSSGGAVSAHLVETALMVGVGAAGGLHVLEQLLVNPVLKKLEAKYSWLAPALNLVTWIWAPPPPADPAPAPAPQPAPAAPAPAPATPAAPAAK